MFVWIINSVLIPLFNNGPSRMINFNSIVLTTVITNRAVDELRLKLYLGTLGVLL